MKQTQLHSIAHNFADSLAGGISFIVGAYDLDVWSVVAANSDKSIFVDFLQGTFESDCDDEHLAAALPLFRNAFPEFCEKHGVSYLDFTEFFVRYSLDGAGKSYTVSIRDRDGRKSIREYVGVPGKKIHVLDDLGRRRPKPSPTAD